MDEEKVEQVGSAEVEDKQLQAAAAADVADTNAVEQLDNEAEKPRRTAGGSSLANKIAAFSSGVAPVKKGITNASEDAITVEEVLHKLESATRAAAASGKTEMQEPLVRSAYDHLVAARAEAARVSKELQELKNSRVQLIPPSAWVKREHKYKMDLEKYEHTISMQQQRIERLELELQVVREGANLKPLEEKIAELESQLVAASEEKTQVQSKYHELSIKHRQLIETSPQVATIWNEVLLQQQAAANGDTAAMQRLGNFDLRHTGANSGLVMSAHVQAAAGQREGSPRKGGNVSTATAIFNSGGPPPANSRNYYAGHPQLLEAGSIEQGPETPVLSDAASLQTPPAARAAASRPAAAAAAAAAAPAATGEPQTAEERAKALMAAVALEGLSPEASIAALQQLNYDLTMQLGLYQQMVARLKDAMELSDLEKAELEADKSQLEAQLVSAGGGDHMSTASSLNSAKANRSMWGSFWRRGTTAGEEHDGEGSIADGMSLASSSRRSSMNLDDPATVPGGVGGGGSGSPSLARHSSSREAAGTPTSVDGSEAHQQLQPRTSSMGDSGSQQGDGVQSQLPVSSSAAAAASPGPPAAAAAAAASPGHPVAAGAGVSLFGRRSSRTAAAKAATEQMRKELRELKRQLNSAQEENKFLVQNLVEIKMELAETQSNHDQAKRALVRAMDKEACLDMRVTELANMLDMVTQQQLWHSPDALFSQGAAERAASLGRPTSTAANTAGPEHDAKAAAPDNDPAVVKEAAAADIAAAAAVAAAAAATADEHEERFGDSGVETSPDDAAETSAGSDISSKEYSSAADDAQDGAAAAVAAATNADNGQQQQPQADATGATATVGLSDGEQQAADAVA